jgi:AbrB family looped-hinge helix DNA binding protein
MEKLPPIPKVFGTVTVGERGQVVIPAAIRKSYHLNPGDKLIVISGEGGPIGFVPVADFNLFIKHHEQFLAQIRKNGPNQT